MSYPLENALFQWEEGARRVRDLEEDRGAVRRADRVIAAITDELRRRIGPTFSAAELADLYAEGTDWCLEVAFATASPGPLDPQELADAAFWRYQRGASDFAGGRQLTPD